LALSRKKSQQTETIKLTNDDIVKARNTTIDIVTIHICSWCICVCANELKT